MDYLRRIEDAVFPLHVTNPTDVRNAAVLVAAGLVEAELPGLEGDAQNEPAIITRITPVGRATLERERRGPGSESVANGLRRPSDST
jgi:hypothetical protein